MVSSILSAREEIGETFIIVSHDMDFVEMICDRVAYIKNGKLVSIGRPDEILPKIKKQQDKIMRTTIQFGPQHPVCAV